jgi:hypothetical protein
MDSPLALRLIACSLPTLVIVAAPCWVGAAPGDIDPTFGSDRTGRVTTQVGGSAVAKAIVWQKTDEKIVAAGNSDNHFALVRYKLNGTPDPSFGDFDATSGQRTGKGKPDGVGGASFAVVRYLNNLCGNEIPEPGEECDLGSNNETPGACCTANCTLFAREVPCRPASGPCDIPETCTGNSATCPPDQFMPGGEPCGSFSGDECDLPDMCSGDSPTCPDRVREYGAPCRDDGVACLDDICNGVDKLCTHPLKNEPGCPLRDRCGLRRRYQMHDRPVSSRRSCVRARTRQRRRHLPRGGRSV